MWRILLIVFSIYFETVNANLVVSVGDVTTNSLRLSWTESATNYSAYRTFYIESVDPQNVTFQRYVNQSISHLNQNGSRDISGLESGVRYTFKFVADDGQILALTATTTKPKPPLTIAATPLSTPRGNISVTISRDSNSTQDKYDISWTSSQCGGASSSYEFVPGAVSTSYNVPLALTPGCQFDLSVKSVSGTTHSDPLSLSVSTYPSIPSFTASSTELSITLSINGSSGRRERYVISATPNGGAEVSTPVMDTNQVVSYTLPNLTSGKQYTILVASESNSLTSLSPSQTVYTVPQSPTNVTVAPSIAQTVTVTWAHTQSFSWSYEVKFRNGSGDTHNATCTTTPCTQNVAAAGPPGTQVFFIVTAIIGNQRSATATGSGYTVPNPPTDATLVTQYSTSLVFSVTVPIVSSDFVLRATSSPVVTNITFSNENHPYTVRLNNLTPGQSYTINFTVVVGSTFNSQPLQEIEYTLPPMPDDLIEDVSIINTTSISVRWNPPTTGVFNGYVFKINNSQSIIVNRSATSYLLMTNSLAGSQYNITFQTTIDANGGELSSPPIYRLFRTSPNPVSSAAVENVSTTAFTVTWTDPTGVFDKFQVQRGTDTREILLDNERHADFFGLVSGTLYVVNITTFSGYKPSEPASFRFYTRPEKVDFELENITVSSVTVRWIRRDNYNGHNLTLEYLNGTRVAGITLQQESSYSFNSGIVAGNSYRIKMHVYITSAQGSVNSDENSREFTALPNAPSALTFTGKSTTEVSVTWSAPTQGIFDGFEIVQSYDQMSNTDTIAMPPKVYTGLVPGRRYMIRIRSYKGGGNNRVFSSHLESTVVMKPIIPANLRVVEAQARLIRIQWDPAPNDVTGYRVEWRRSNSTVSLPSSDLLTTSFTIDNLDQGRDYTITVQTYSGSAPEREYSAPQTITQTTTLYGTSLGIPNFGTNFIEVTWEEPEGDFTQYGLAISPGNFGLVIVARNQSRTHRFEPLMPGKTYTMTITVLSNTANTSSTRTQTTKPLPVEQLRIDGVMGNSMAVHWSTNNSSTQDKFQINYIGVNADVNKIVEINYTQNQQQYSITLQELISGDQYNVTVVPVSNNDVRGDSRSLTQATIPGPVAMFSGSSTTERDVTLTWTLLANNFVDSFLLEYLGRHVHTTMRNATIPASSTTHTVQNLFPGEHYTYTIYCQRGNQRSSEYTLQKTQAPLPPAIVGVLSRSTNTLTFSWTFNNATSFATRYNVSLKKYQESETVGNFFVDGQERQHIFSSLIPGQRYTFSILSVSTSESSLRASEFHAYATPSFTATINETRTTENSVTFTYGQETSVVVLSSYNFSINEPAVQTQTRTVNDAREVTFFGLRAGLLYTIQAISISGDQFSPAVTKSILTNPATPTEIQCDQDSSQLTVIVTSIVNVDTFRVTCSSNCNQDQQEKNAGSEGNEVMFVWNSLVPFMDYSFNIISIRRTSDFTKTSSTQQLTCRTESAPPGEVQNLRFDLNSVSPFRIKVTWEEPLPKNGDIIKYTVSYIGTRLNFPNHRSTVPVVIEVDPAIANTGPFEQVLDNLKGGYTYNITVYATTLVTRGEGHGVQSTINVTLPVWDPEIDVTYTVPTAENIGKVDHVTATLNIVDPFNDKHGEVVAYSVIVAKRNNDVTRTTKEQTWVQTRGRNDPYVAIYKCADLFDHGHNCLEGYGAVESSRRKRELFEEVSVTLGTESCDRNEPEVYCNGPLSPSTRYYVYLRGYTDFDSFTDIRVPYEFETEKEPSGPGANTGPIIGGVVGGAVVLILICVVVFLLLKRRNNKPHRRSSGRKSDFLHLRETRYQSRPVKISEFSAHVVTMSKDSDFLFAQEYEDLKEVGKDQAWDNAMLPVNRVKNRFTNILPYDHSRVKLLPSEDEEGSDYINASWMPGFNSKREFICAQGPLPSTTDDFWRMVWEQNCRAIVMLTRCVEKGRDKCAQYWPVDSEPMFYGDVQVEIRNEFKSNEWVITESNVSKGETVRRITHFHYTAWPDFDVPKVPQCLIRFVRTVRQRLPPELGPIVVHCSAGVGRSGTFVVVDRLLQHLAQPDAETLDIPAVVGEMRRFRCWMVQTESQYIFIHHGLQCVIEGKENENLLDGEDNPAYEEADEGIHI